MLPLCRRRRSSTRKKPSSGLPREACRWDKSETGEPRRACAKGRGRRRVPWRSMRGPLKRGAPAGPFQRRSPTRPPRRQLGLRRNQRARRAGRWLDTAGKSSASGTTCRCSLRGNCGCISEAVLPSRSPRIRTNRRRSRARLCDSLT